MGTRLVHSVRGDLPQLRERSARGVALLQLLWRGPRRSLDPAGAAQDRNVLFCDLVGSTSLGESTDPEALRALLARYFERMKAIVERHGGTVEKFIGDAVMAVFGVPMLHEDDALRAVRSAMEMREALPELGLQGRIGVMTGEVVTGTEERLATGDAVNIVARLEQAAQPSEILIGQETVSGAVETQAVEPLEVKGKAQPLVAYRLVTVTGETPRRHTGPMVGRKRELRLLAGAWDRAASWALLPAVHDPGCSRSRQVASRCRVPRAVADATVAHGRAVCPTAKASPTGQSWTWHLEPGMREPFPGWGA